MASLIGLTLHFVIILCAEQKLRFRSVMCIGFENEMTLHKGRVKVMSGGEVQVIAINVVHSPINIFGIQPGIIMHSCHFLETFFGGEKTCLLFCSIRRNQLHLSV